jgi:GT2 family glycosyltransferase/glycosyltransferase involved in cell wall biosynthesis
MKSAIKPFFDERFYGLYEDLRQAKLRDPSFDLFQHFLEYGITEGRSPSPLFDLHFVRSKLARYNGKRVDLPDVIGAFFDISAAERFVPNSWFSPWSFRRLYGPVFEDEIETLSDYGLFEYYIAHVREGALSPNGVFSEEEYRARYPDVAEALRRGEWESGFLQFIYCGADEGRRNLPSFDLSLYRSLGGGETERDYILTHHADLRQVVPWFDETFYLSVYEDAHELKRREMIRSGLEHFLVLGFSEGRIPHPAMLERVARASAESAWACMAALEEPPCSRVSLAEASHLLQHLLQHLSERGLRKDRRRLANAIWRFVEPPPVGGRFDELAYLAINTDVAKSLAGSPAELAFSHWREHGLKEQRVAPGSNIFADRRLGRQDFLDWRSGVNFFGPLSATSGLGNAARGYVAALRSAGVPVDTYDVSRLISRDLPLDLFSSGDLSYSINLMYLNPDQVIPFVDTFGSAIFDHRANVGFWVWELPSPRPEWRSALSGFDLIVTPSEFCTDCFASFTNRPVVSCPHVVDEGILLSELKKVTANRWVSLLEAEKAAGKRVVLFVMDASSYVARKGVDVFLGIAARYEEAHPGECVFVLKTHSKDHSNSTYRVNNRSVVIINEVLSFPDLLKLKSIADVYLSPHRSEGFGLNIFESIVLGVPALCSDYGGSLDSLPEDYPFRIPGRLIEVERDMGPYRRHAIWFEPSLDAAYEMLRQMLGAEHLSREFRPIAQTVRARLSTKRVGVRFRRILEKYCGFSRNPGDRSQKRFIQIAKPKLDECFDLGVPARLQGAARLTWLREATVPAASPTFSVITPTYNTPPEFLRDLYEDLVAQTFHGWEWCLCDDGSSRPETLAALRELRAKDARVRIKFLPKNQGISAATNAGVTIASGAYLIMADHDDRVSPDLLASYFHAIQRDASIGIFYCDEDKIDPDGRHCERYFKPDWSPEHVMSAMYVLHCLCIKKFDFLALGGYRSEFDGAQDHDFVLRAAAAATRIGHVDQLLYHWRKAIGSAASSSEAKKYAVEAGRRAVADHVSRLKLRGKVEHGSVTGTYRVRPEISPGRVSLNILTACTRVPNGRQTYVEQFVRSILAHDSGGVDFEIRVIVDAGRLDIAASLAEIDPRVELVPFRRNSAHFSFAEKANFAVRTSNCDRILLLNDDMEVIDPGWLAAMVEVLELPGVGVAGGRLLHEDGSIQHAGIVLGIYGRCAHVFEHEDPNQVGYNAFTHVIRNYSAVTGALMAFRRSTFDLVGGFDQDFPVDYNDVDFCLRVIESGLRVVYTPFAELRHFESRSAKRMAPDSLDTQRFQDRWSAYIARDPFYNSNLTRDGILFQEPCLASAGAEEAPHISFEELGSQTAPAVQFGAGQTLSASVPLRSIEDLAAQGFVITSKPDLNLVVGGEVVLPFWVDGMIYHFELPNNDVQEVRIVSRSFIPGEVWPDSPASKDARRLGVCLSGIVLHVGGVPREIAISNPLLRRGFHGVETNGVQEWRWTDGDASFSLALPESAKVRGGIFMELRLLWPGSYWIQPEPHELGSEKPAAPPPWTSASMQGAGRINDMVGTSGPASNTSDLNGLSQGLKAGRVQPVSAEVAAGAAIREPGHQTGEGRKAARLRRKPALRVSQANGRSAPVKAELNG